jgi:hypothetical protein
MNTPSNKQLADEVARLRGLLAACGLLFSQIRGDWSDPRYACREGWRLVDMADTDDPFDFESWRNRWNCDYYQHLLSKG